MVADGGSRMREVLKQVSSKGYPYAYFVCKSFLYGSVEVIDLTRLCFIY